MANSEQSLQASEGPKHHRYQLCTYRCFGDKTPRYGLAKMKHSFALYDVEFILDCETGEKIAYNAMDAYELIAGPMAYISTKYPD
jgi:hypothetical protein